MNSLVKLVAKKVIIYKEENIEKINEGYDIKEVCLKKKICEYPKGTKFSGCIFSKDVSFLSLYIIKDGYKEVVISGSINYDLFSQVVVSSYINICKISKSISKLCLYSSFFSHNHNKDLPLLSSNNSKSTQFADLPTNLQISEESIEIPSTLNIDTLSHERKNPIPDNLELYAYCQ